MIFFRARFTFLSIISTFFVVRQNDYDEHYFNSFVFLCVLGTCASACRGVPGSWCPRVLPRYSRGWTTRTSSLLWTVLSSGYTPMFSFLWLGQNVYLLYILNAVFVVFFAVEGTVCMSTVYLILVFHVSTKYHHPQERDKKLSINFFVRRHKIVLVLIFL